MFFFFFKQKTAYEMRISDWSSDVCSSDLFLLQLLGRHRAYDLVGVYDADSLAWLMRRIEAKARGRTLACHTVTDGKQPLGVFAYVLRADGYAEVLFSYAREGRFDFVLSAMVTDAAARGDAVLPGTVKQPRVQCYQEGSAAWRGREW